MAWRIYVMPMVGAGIKGDPRRPAYADTDLSGINWSCMDFGWEPVCLVTADVTAGQHVALVTHLDVTALPADLTQQIGGSLATVQTALETLNIPAGWVTSGMKFSRVLRVVATMCLFLHRFQTFTANRIFTGGINLNSTFGQLPISVRTALQNAATDLGLDSSPLTGSSTIRQCIKVMADQYSISNISFGDQVV